MASISGNKGIPQNGNSRVPRKNKITRSVVWLLIWSFAPALPTSSARADRENGDIILTDLWDMPSSIHSICDGKETLFFICDPEILSCREGAVHFDSQVSRIRARSIQPVCIFLTSPAAARDAVLTMGIQVPVYIDARRNVLGRLIQQEVLPAMVLTDQECKAKRIIYGGGESLDNNISMMLGDVKGKSHRALVFGLIAVAVLSIVLLAVD